MINQTAAVLLLGKGCKKHQQTPAVDSEVRCRPKNKTYVKKYREIKVSRSELGEKTKQKKHPWRWTETWLFSLLNWSFILCQKKKENHKWS